jgi:hypothetical protein
MRLDCVIINVINTVNNYMIRAGAISYAKTMEESASEPRPYFPLYAYRGLLCSLAIPTIIIYGGIDYRAGLSSGELHICFCYNDCPRPKPFIV